jgi:hypothetical protein
VNPRTGIVGAAAPAPMNIGIVGVGTRHRGATALPHLHR